MITTNTSNKMYYLIYVNNRLVYKVHTTKDCIDKTCLLQQNGYKDKDIQVVTVIGDLVFNTLIRKEED